MPARLRRTEGVGGRARSGVGRGRAHGLVGEHPGCKLLLSLLEAGARPAVQGVDLEGRSRLGVRAWGSRPLVNRAVTAQSSPPKEGLWAAGFDPYPPFSA